MNTHHLDGPYFEDFRKGDVFGAPSVTVTEGHTAFYQALTGDRLRLPLDRHLSARVTGEARALVHPMLVINLVNGQTTHASQHVKGNLFYRGLLLQQPVFVGDTLTTTTTVVGLRQNRPKPGRAATGMVALEMDTRNQHGDCVLKYWRCPMIPCRDAAAETGAADEFDWIPSTLSAEQLAAAVPANWAPAVLRDEPLQVPAPEVAVGDRVRIGPQDTVTCAPELVRLTGNVAYTHTDASRSYLGRRLVYGGHTISLAFAQVTRALPNLVTLLAWQSGDHLGPVLEDDIIRSEFELVSASDSPAGGTLQELLLKSFALRRGDDDGYDESAVLEMRIVVWNA